MANEINIGINTTSDLSGLDKVDQSVKSLKTQLKEAQANVAALSDTFGATSKQAVDAAKSAAMLKDKIGDAKALTDAFNPDAKFKAVSASLTGVAGGFSAITGAMGLFGAESKDVEKAILKVQSAMALASGIQAIGESADAFRNMKAVAVNAFNAIKGAIGATGIGLLVIALGTIVAYWDDIKGAVSGVSEEQKKLNKSTDDNLKTQKSKLDSINAQDATLKLQGKSEKQILNIKQAATKEVYIASKAQLENNIATTKAQVDASKRNKEILRGTLEFLTSPLALLLKTIDSVGSALGKDFGLEEKLYGGLASMVFNPEEVQKEADKVIAEQTQALTVLKNQIDTYELAKKDLDKKASDEAIQKQKEQSQKLQAQRDEAAKKALEKKEKENELAKQQQEKQNADLEKYTKEQKDAFDKRTEDEYQQSVDLMNLQDVGFEDDLNKKLAHYEHLKTIQEDYGKSTIDIDTQIAATKIDIAQKQSDKEKAIEEAKLEMKRMVADKTIQVAGQAGQLLQEIAGKSKGVAIGGVIVEKAASIAGIISSTAQANAQFLANPVSAATLGTAAISPIALNNISAGISIASILAQSAKSISEINGAKSSDTAGGGATQTPSKFATGGLVQGMGTSTSDSIMANLSNGESVINAKSTAMFGNLLSNINQAGGGVGFGTQNNANPIFKTYVVASEMTSQIEANLKLKQIARL
jgi:hypothetical protein